MLAIVVSMEMKCLGGDAYAPTRIIGALDWEAREGVAQVVEGPWRKCGVVIAPDQPFECGDNILINLFPVKKPCEDGAPWFYTVYSTKTNFSNLVMMEKHGKHLLVRDGKGDFTLEGLPEDMRPSGPEVFKLGPHHYRMYFWAHGTGGAMKLRLMLAESTDLHHWKMANGGKPLFSHHGDSTWGDGLPISRICNDAMTIYRHQDGNWEVFSAAVTTIKDSRSPYANKELCPGFVRIIMRWTSPDGLHFSAPEVVLAPDAQDSPATQCYYLSMLDLEPYTVGVFGNFNTRNQRLLMEPVMSRDHRHWTRPLRHALFEDDYVTSVCITDIALEADGNVSLFYSASNTDHDGKIKAGTKPENKLYKAQVPCRKFFGRRLQPGVALVSPIIRYIGRNPRIHISEGAELTCEWQDLFSTTRSRIKLQVTGGIAEVRLSETVNTTAVGNLHITGNGIVYDTEF